tara:strand:+ start:450 stop:2336 length:1887 start_codon:yes stop_codon:yes gene_type:complete
MANYSTSEMGSQHTFSRLSNALWRVLSVVLCISLFFSSSLLAQEPPKKEEPKKDKTQQPVESLLPKPIIVVNVASVERILQDIDFLFELVERPEIAEIASASLANVNDLEGVDKNKNLGAELYLKTGLLPQPVFVSYIPVSKIRAFIDSLEAIIPGDEETIKKDANRDDIYTIQGRRGESMIRIQDAYAHMLFRGGETDETLEMITSRDFDNPVQQFQDLTNNYDFAVKMDLSGIPELMRTTFLGFFRTAIETQLQQRDSESRSAYELRRMSGKQNLENIEYFLNEAQEMVLGAAVDKEQKRGILDILIKARPNSDLARDIKNVPGKASYFSVITSRENLPIAVSASLNVARRDAKAYLAYLSYFEKQLAEKLLTEEERQQNTNSVQQFFAPIKSMVEKRHLDLFVQLVATPSRKFALIGGIKVAPSADLPTALLDLVNRVDQLPDNKAKIFTNAETVQGIALHQLQPDLKTADDKQQRFLGGVPSLYVGADSQVIWFAMGTDIAVSALNDAIERINTASPEERKEQRTAPFQAEFHLKPWLALFSKEEIEQSGDLMNMLDAAFKKDNDLIRITTQPTDNGVRTRMQFDTGYLKLLGYSIAHRFDENQGRRNRKERDEKNKDLPKPAQ